MKLSLLVLGLVVLMGAGMNSAPSQACNDNTIIALEISGEPLAPTWMINQIAMDLMTIRLLYPEVAEITARPDWIPGGVLVRLSGDAWEDYQAGEYTALDSMNTLLGASIISEYPMISLLYLRTEECYHPDFLVAEYGQIEGIIYAEPNGVGGDGDDIFSTEVGYYTFKHGYGDCPAGCIYEDYWVFQVDGGTVTLLDQYTIDSTLTSVQDDLPADPIQGFEVWPNPLNPFTSMRFSLGESGPVSVRVYDVSGRLVRDLASEVFDAGEHEIQWHGQSDSGLDVSSGLYFCTLEGTGWVQTKKVVVLK